MAVCTTCWLSQSDKSQMGFHFCASAPPNRSKQFGPLALAQKLTLHQNTEQGKGIFSAHRLTELYQCKV